MASLSLGAAQSFAFLGGTTVTNTGLTSFVGDVGVSPGSAVTGFPPGIVTGGTIHANDAVAKQAHADLATAYGVLAGETATVDLTGQDLGGRTLASGVYHFATSAPLTGTLTLDAQGNPDARFDFQIGTTLVSASNSAIRLINGARADNVYFQVGSSATLGTNTAFEGNILAFTSITLTTGASLGPGRVLSLGGATTLDTNLASVPLRPSPTLGSLNPASAPEGVNPLTITITGTNFGTDSLVQFNGAALTTTFVNSTQLQATIPAADLGEEAAAALSVFSPGPGGGLSIALPFTITDPAPVATGGFVLNTSFGNATGSQTVATFTDPGSPEPNVNDSSPANINGHYAATIKWGDGTPSTAGTLSVNLLTGVFTVSGGHTYLRSGTFPITTTIVHELVSPVVATSSAIVLDSGLTSATATPVQAVEGQNTGRVVLATFIDPNPASTVQDWSATVTWGDGSTPNTATVALAGGDPVSGGNVFYVTGSHTYMEEGPLIAPSVALTSVSNPAIPPVVLPLIITVVDASLSSSNGTTITGIEGNATGTVLIGTFHDSNPSAMASEFTATLPIGGWGDGSPVAPVTLTVTKIGGTAADSVFEVTGDHTYAETGHFAITVNVTDIGGAITVISSTAVIADARLTPLPIQPLAAAIEHQPFVQPVAAFTDGNPTAPISDFQATIDWGDGSPTSFGSFVQPGGIGTSIEVVGAHTYADSLVNSGPGTPGGVLSGNFIVTVHVSDVEGASTTIVNTLAVSDRVLIVSGSLNPSSDSGQSSSDGITNVAQPNYFGQTSEAFASVFLYASPAGGGLTTLIGQGESNASKAWSITPTTKLADGKYNIGATATDAAGYTNSQFATMTNGSNGGPLVIDTAGPKVASVFLDRNHGQVDITFQDNLSGLDQSTVASATNYTLTKRHTPIGTYLVNVITSTPSGPTGPNTVVLGLRDGKPLRGGHYTLTIHDTILDIAGNKLDGEFYGYFPSGNNVPGGNFVANIDSIHNIVFAPQTIVGHATPVSPPGTPGTTTKIPLFVPQKVHAFPLHIQKVTDHNTHDAALTHVQVKSHHQTKANSVASAPRVFRSNSRP